MGTLKNGVVDQLLCFMMGSKTSQSTTMFTGSNALAEVLCPYFQFATLAKSEEC